ncbi:O-antigen ligase family protein [Clostridium perfringens]|nr:O-antigen ligase family protein [Clostridium perfringens]MDK0444775.1 O-antigen ligase family protein [Clostridium perfringens]MDK0498511.1 O-antigen ligase family protein [Clostridium perfringens]MDK0501431.1 O-antigen ligase family protein [Clostridium perfringens]MDM0739866.1 O-antigen ligase family protein [Clostridium perfringens]
MTKELKKTTCFILVLLILNLNSKLSYVSIILLFFYGIKSNENSVKAIIYSFILSQLNTTLFSSDIGSLRTILNIFFIIKLIFSKEGIEELGKSFITIILIVYTFFITIAAFYVSWLPLVSIFKGIYFTMGFLAIYIAVSINKDKNWILWISNYFKVFLIINLPFIFLPQGYSANGTALNGIIANPNGLGIILTLGLAIFLYSKSSNVLVALSIICIFLTNSRTSIITTILILLYYIFIHQIFILKYGTKKFFKKLSLICFLIALLIGLSNLYMNPMLNLINKKIMKGQEQGEVLKSRENQLESFYRDFNKNKIIGVGFGVDGKELFKQEYSFKLSYPVERGNILLAILAETGYVGLCIFILLILSLIYYSFKNNEKIERFLFSNLLLISALMISLGEMTFFSGNSLGVIQWFFLSLYALGKVREEDEDRICKQY